MRTVVGYGVVSFGIVCLLLAATASAQVPGGAPESSLTLAGGTAGAAPTGDTKVLEYQATLAIKNVACQGAVSFPVTLTATPTTGNGSNLSGAKISAVARPTSLSFDAAAGLYGSSAPFAPYSKTLPFSVELKAENTSRPLNVTVTVSAAFGGGSQCTGGGPIPAATATPIATTIPFGRTAPEVTSKPEPKMPVPVGAVLVALVGALAWARRRQA